MKQGWEIKKLGEIATYVNGYAFKPEHWRVTGVPIIRIQNLNNLDAEFNYCDSDIPLKFVVENGDILISWSASLGVYEWNRGKAYLNQHIFKVVFDKINISKYFLKYAVSAKLNEMLKDAHGATMKHIIKSDFDNTTIPYPPLSEQKKIVAELDCLSGIIEKKKQQLKEYDALAQSIFYEMFGNPIDNEKGWEVKKLGEVCDVRDGTHDSPKYLEQSDYVLITSKNIVGNTIDFTSANHISEDDYININKRSCVDDGDIIMAMIGTIGNPIIVKDIDRKFCIKNVALIKFAQSTLVTNVYIRALLDNKCYYQYIQSQNKGGTQKFVALGTIRNFTTPIPPLILQQEFASKIEAIEKQKELIKQSITETEELFNSRMDYYFN